MGAPAVGQGLAPPRFRTASHTSCPHERPPCLPLFAPLLLTPIHLPPHCTTSLPHEAPSPYPPLTCPSLQEAAQLTVRLTYLVKLEQEVVRKMPYPPPAA